MTLAVGNGRLMFFNLKWLEKGVRFCNFAVKLVKHFSMSLSNGKHL